jgi:DNA-binding transcriptional LysR family regulator
MAMSPPIGMPRPANFVDESVDVSIRLGEIREPSLIVRRLGNAARQLYASPAHLARRGVPNHPADLGQHDCVLQSNMAQPAIWRLISGESSVDVDVRGRLSTNNVSMTLRFVEQGIRHRPACAFYRATGFRYGHGPTRARRFPNAGACGDDVQTGTRKGQSLYRFPRQPPGRMSRRLLSAPSLRTTVRRRS